MNSHKKDFPQVSIIIFNDNNEVGLEHTLRSIASQTYSNLECLVADNGSADGSVNLISENSSKVAYYISENLGSVNALLSKVLLKASGDYILILQSGDYLYGPDVIDSLLDGIKAETGLIYGNIVRLFPNGEQDILRLPETFTANDILYGEISFLPVSLIKASLFYKYNFYDESIYYVNDWAFLLKALFLDSIAYQHKDISVAAVRVNRAGGAFKLSNGHLMGNEKNRILDSLLSPALLSFIKEKQAIEGFYWRYHSASVESKLLDAKDKIGKLIKSKIATIKYQLRSARSAFELSRYRREYAAQCYAIPIIINNRNHLTYLKRLIESLEKRGYHNIYIIDNGSDYAPLMAYYEATPHKVFLLKKNVGFCALWETDIFENFKDQYYVYTDSDLEIVEDCPDDFMTVMHYLLNRYSLGKVGFSLLTNDLPDHFANSNQVKQWEAKFSEEKIEHLAYAAQVDTTFALYKPNNFGYAGMLRSFRTSYPYSARHLPWYENTNALTSEQEYYYKNVKTSSHWSSKVNVK